MSVGSVGRSPFPFTSAEATTSPDAMAAVLAARPGAQAATQTALSAVTSSDLGSAGYIDGNHFDLYL